jgi:hypothetical protein
MTFSNCTPASSSTTATSYYDNGYVPLGFNNVGISYGVYVSPPTIPTFVTIGGTGGVGTETLYRDSTKTTVIGRLDVSYLVETESATTAVINLIGKNYNAAGTLTSTEKNRYRINSTGTLIPISADLQYTDAAATHLLITYN